MQTDNLLQVLDPVLTFNDSRLMSLTKGTLIGLLLLLGITTCILIGVFTEHRNRKS